MEIASLLKLSNIDKHYGAKQVLDEITIEINIGDIYGFIGENGAGKTTTIKILLGLITPTAGEIIMADTIDGKAFARNNIGVLFEQPMLFENMSAVDNLVYQQKLYGMSYDNVHILTTLELVGLSSFGDKKVKTFSQGMRQRLGIAKAILTKPKLLVLDEPMKSLDPTGILQIRDLLLRLNREDGVTIFLSTHILNELQLVASRYGIIHKGKMIKEISSEGLAEATGKLLNIKVSDAQAALNLMNTFPEYNFKVKDNGTIDIYSATGDYNLNLILGRLINTGIKILDINTASGSVENYYVRLVHAHGHAIN